MVRSFGTLTVCVPFTNCCVVANRPDATLLIEMFRAVTTSSLIGSRKQMPLEAISRRLPLMAELGMKDAIIAAMSIGDFIGCGFVPCAAPDAQPTYADMKDHPYFVYRQGPFSVPLDMDGKSLFHDILSPEVGGGGSEKNDHRRPSGVKENIGAVVDGVEAVVNDAVHRRHHPHQPARPHGKSVLEVSVYRVALPHLGDLKTLRALVGMGPKAIEIFSTPAVRNPRIALIVSCHIARIISFLTVSSSRPSR